MQTASFIVVALALIPAAILMVVMLIRDKEQPEPMPWLAKGLLFGVLAALGSTLISVPLIMSGLVPANYGHWFEAILHSFGAAAIPEETAKLFFLWLLLRKNPYFDEHLDGIVYAACIGLGAVLQGLIPVTPETKACFLLSGGSVGLDQLDILKK